MIAAYSSAVPVRRLLDAILGTSPATWIWAKRPSGVKIKMPLGVSPNGNDFLPSGAVPREGGLRGVYHRARVRATRWLTRPTSPASPRAQAQSRDRAATKQPD